MNERIANNSIEGPNEPHFELKEDRQEMLDQKWEYLEDVKNNLHEVFGVDHLPKEFVEQDVLPIRRKIREQVEAKNYVESLSEETRSETAGLAYLVSHFQVERRPINKAERDEEGDISVVFKDGSSYRFNADERRLAEDMENYFDAYRLTRNAHKFRKNVKEAERDAIETNEKERRVFRSESEKNKKISAMVFGKYKDAGFSEKEIGELVKMSELSPDDIHEISVLRGLGEIWNRYISGDKTRFVAISAALTLPAAVEGIAPRFLAATVGNNANTMESLAIYSALSLGVSGGFAYLSRWIRDFVQKNSGKQGGFDEHVAENVTGLPGREIVNLGMGTINDRVENARSNYDWLAKIVSYEVLPSAVMMGSSAISLALKSPTLAGATVGGAALTLLLNKYVEAKSGLWTNTDEKKRRREELANKLHSMLDGHMEMVLSGQREVFEEELGAEFAKGREADAELNASRSMVNFVRGTFRHLNLVTAGAASMIAGGGGELFINALLYQGNFQEGTRKLLEVRTNLITALRDIAQMELTFNGFVDEEKEKEKNRVGVDEVANGNLNAKNINYEIDGTKILENIDLEIPQGQMVSLRGGSGAGKSTLLKILAGYLGPTSGEVGLGGINLDGIKRYGPQQLYKRVAYLSQEPLLQNGKTVRENICFGVSSEVTDEEIKAVLEEVGLKRRFSNLNEQIVFARENGSSSPGEKQRIGLARMILKLRKDQLQLAFIDEPTAALDEDLKVQIGRIVNEEKKRNPDVTFIAISHDAEFRDQLEGAREIFLENGKIVQSRSDYDES